MTKFSQKEPIQFEEEEETPKNIYQKIVKFCLVTKPDKKPLLTLLLKRILIPCLQKLWFQLIVLVLWIAVSVSCFRLTSSMQEGLEQSRVARYDSQVAKYFEAEVRTHHMPSRILDVLFVNCFSKKKKSICDKFLLSYDNLF